MFTVDQLTAVGGSEWQKDTMHRVYFNDLFGLYGLKLSHYNTGNISAAWLDGSEISNSAARRISGQLSGAKVYYDLVTGAWSGRIDQAYLNVIIAEIERRIAAGPTMTPAARYVCEECGAGLQRPHCPSCDDDTMIREVA